MLLIHRCAFIDEQSSEICQLLEARLILIKLLYIPYPFAWLNNCLHFPKTPVAQDCQEPRYLWTQGCWNTAFLSLSLRCKVCFSPFSLPIPVSDVRSEQKMMCDCFQSLGGRSLALPFGKDPRRRFAPPQSTAVLTGAVSALLMLKLCESQSCVLLVLCCGTLCAPGNWGCTEFVKPGSFLISVISIARGLFFLCDLYRITSGNVTIALLLPDTLQWGFLLLWLVRKWFFWRKAHDSTLSSNKTDLKED